MNFLKRGASHAYQIYLVGAGILIFSLLSGSLWNRTPAMTLLRMLCDGFSVSAAAYFLLAYVYRPKGYGFREVMAYYGRRVRGCEASDPGKRAMDRELEKIVDNDFLESLLMLWICLALTILCLALYMI